MTILAPSDWSSPPPNIPLALETPLQTPQAYHSFKTIAGNTQQWMIHTLLHTTHTNKPTGTPSYNTQHLPTVNPPITNTPNNDDNDSNDSNVPFHKSWLDEQAAHPAASHSLLGHNTSMHYPEKLHSTSATDYMNTQEISKKDCLKLQHYLKQMTSLF